MNIISQKDELKKLLIPKVSEFGLGEGIVEEILSVARDFSENELKPHALGWDEIGTHLDESIPGKKKLIFPEGFVETQKKLAETGLFGSYIPEEYGGSGLPYMLYSSVIEILSGGDANFGVHVSVHGTAADLINRYGTNALKERLLPDMASGKKLGCLVFTEATGGSDLKAISTTSELIGSCYSVNGNKFSITNGGYADVHVVFTVDMEDFNLPFAKRKKYNVIIVEKGTEGMELLGIGNTMGWRASPTSLLKFENCSVPAENLLGERGNGRNILSRGLSSGRISFGCAWSLGIADAAYRKAMEHAQRRATFGQPIKDHIEIRKHLADMYRYLWMGRRKYINAAYLKDKNDPDFPFEATISKIFCSERALDIARIAYQIHGHMGYVNESGIPLLLKNILVATVGEGGTEVLRERVIVPAIRNDDYSRINETVYDRSFSDKNLGEDVFEELANQLGDELYPCYEILVSKSTGKKIKVPAAEIKHLTINWKLNRL